MDLNLAGRHALVCGASQGIGRACAIELAALGADVTLLARRADVLRGVADELPRPRGQAHHDWIALDVSDTDGLRAAAAKLTAARPVHVLVNNSGGPPPGSALDATIEAFLAAYRQHLIADHVLASAVIPGMRAAGYGRIINVLSTSVREPIPGLAVSNATRWAVAAWAKTLAAEVAPFGITVNDVLPGSTDTPRIQQLAATRAREAGTDIAMARRKMTAAIPLGRFAKPAEIAAAVAFLASPAASYITGVALPVDGGRLHSP